MQRRKGGGLKESRAGHSNLSPQEKQRQEVLYRFEPSQVEVVRFCCESNNCNNFHFIPPTPKLQESLTLKKNWLKTAWGGVGWEKEAQGASKLYEEQGAAE